MRVKAANLIAKVVVGIRDENVEYNSPPQPQLLSICIRSRPMLSQCVGNFHIAAGFVIFQPHHAHRREKWNPPCTNPIKTSNTLRLATDIVCPSASRHHELFHISRKASPVLP
jgi:hypothetical protein